MIPILLDAARLRFGLAGHGPAVDRRQRLLAEAGARDVQVFADDPPGDDALAGIDVLWIAGMPVDEAVTLAERARAQRVLVNTEDVAPLCDFHNVAVVRRGAMILSAGTGGMAPQLARRLRVWLEDKFPPAWVQRTTQLAQRRQDLKAAGASNDEVAQALDQMIDENGWLT